MTKKHYNIFLQMLSGKRYDLEGFAEFAKTIGTVQECRQVEQSKVSFVINTLHALISSGISVSDQLNKLLEKVEWLWENCEDAMREAKEFVASQTPIKAQGLHENILVSFVVCVCVCGRSCLLSCILCAQVCEDEMSSLVVVVNQLPYTDPNEQSSKMLAELSQVRCAYTCTIPTSDMLTL